MQTLHSVRLTTGAHLNVAARDAIIQNYYYSAQTIDLPPGLKSIANFRKVHIATLGRATPGTCLWIFDWETFRIWLDPDGFLKIMWGSGMPGAGKTIMASIVINFLEARARASTQPICVAYVYIRYSDHAKATIRGILEVLVKQTAERHPGCLALAEEVYASHSREETQATEEELLSLLQRFTAMMSVTFYVLDALDEAPTAIQLDIIERLACLNVKLFITSRPLKVVEVHFPDAHCFPIVAQDNDIELHIAKEISRSAELRAILGPANAALRDEIVSTIKQKCRGMFLHAALQLDALRDCTSVFDVKETLEEFPTPIEGVYTQTWNRILDQPKKKALLAKSVLLWVLTATRSMTMEELQHAVATCPDTYHFDTNRRVPGDTLIGLCGGLVDVEKESGLVRLVHYTAKDTLGGLIHQTTPHPHPTLAAICVTHLTDCGFQNTTFQSKKDLEEALQADPLLAYAHDAWSTHAHKSLDVASAVGQLTEFVAGCNAFPVLPSAQYGGLDILGPLHVAAFFNLPIAMAGPQNLHDPNLPTRRQGTTALCLACDQNSQRAVEELLGLSHILVNGAAKGKWPALMIATVEGHLNLVQLLLAHPEIQVNLADHLGRTALTAAAQNGFDGIVAVLLAHPEIRVNRVDIVRRTPLMLASQNGYDGTVKSLLSHPKIAVNLADNNGRTPLMVASKCGHDDTVAALLAHSQTKINVCDKDGCTALIWASKYGRASIAKLLLAHPRTLVNSADNDGLTALMTASENDQHEVVQLLLAHPKTQINAVNSWGQTALMCACLQEESERTVKLLLEHPQLEVNLMDHVGRTALTLASTSGYKGVVECLLTHPRIEVKLSDVSAARVALQWDVARLLDDFMFGSLTLLVKD